MSYAGKIITLITGANIGIGFETVNAIAASSKYHVIMACRSLERGQKALDDVLARKPEGAVSLLEIDLSNKDTIVAAASAVEKQFGRLDVLVNNAAIAKVKGDLLTNLRETFETNVFGTAVMTREFLPLLKKSQDARVIYVSSGVGSLTLRSDPNHHLHKTPPLIEYRASKSALNMVVLHDHITLGPEGIKVWAMCPGHVGTSLGVTPEERSKAEKHPGAGKGDPAVSAQTILSLIDGRRDADVGKFVHKDGIYPW